MFFYLLDALHGERKDRSVLFWKSMPVSDTTTVLSKLFTGAGQSAPAIVIAVTIVTQIVVLLLASVILMIGGATRAAIWGNLQLFQVTIALVYGQIASALWYAPMAAWLLFVSSWAKRVPILWAVLTPVAVVLFERVASARATCRTCSAIACAIGLKLRLRFRAHRGEFTDRRRRRQRDGACRGACSTRSTRSASSQPVAVGRPRRRRGVRRGRDLDAPLPRAALTRS